MLDLKYLRSHPEEAERRLQSRNPEYKLERLLALDAGWRGALMRVEELRAERNAMGEAIAAAKKTGGDADQAIRRMSQLKTELAGLETQSEEFKAQLDDELLKLPNLPDPRIPASPNKEDFRVLRENGEEPSFSFPVKDHVELGEALGILDFAAGAKLAGAGYPLYRGQAALLEWALLTWMFTQAAAKGYEPILPPYLASADSLYCSSQLPKFMGDIYRLAEDDLYLIPTSEVPLVNLGRDVTFEEAELPRRFTAVTPCFRREAGTYGRDNRGLVRTHQFNKVELVAIATPQQADAAFEEILAHAESILARLGLRYRTILLSSGDIAGQAAMTADVEVWCPGMNRWWEVSSVSNCTDYQARRGGIRYRSGGKTALCHTLNGSGTATSRLLPAIMETFQLPDGRVAVPEVLHPYTGFTHLG